MTELKANRQYKDRVFRMIFNSREKLLELYNAMNGTDYESAEDLEIVTLENAIYLAMRNDLAYVFHDELFLYEQQSSKMEICLCAVSFMSATAIPEWSGGRISMAPGRLRYRLRHLLFFTMERIRLRKARYCFLMPIVKKWKSPIWNCG